MPVNAYQVAMKGEQFSLVETEADQSMQDLAEYRHEPAVAVFVAYTLQGHDGDFATMAYSCFDARRRTSTHARTHPPIHPSTHPPINPSTHPPTHILALLNSNKDFEASIRWRFSQLSREQDLRSCIHITRRTAGGAGGPLVAGSTAAVAIRLMPSGQLLDCSHGFKEPSRCVSRLPRAGHSVWAHLQERIIA